MQIQNATINAKPWRVTINMPGPALYRVVFEYNEEVVAIRETHEPITFSWLAAEMERAIDLAIVKVERDYTDLKRLRTKASAKIKPQAE